ncbi:MAG: M81 family metallopeptidase [Chloroflexia bacterium]|nr:M81 family metallopeptidase [Chloroflexia bacterium]
MRIVTGGILHETHTFSNDIPGVEDFMRASGGRGEEVRSFAGTNTSIGGVLDECNARGIELVPTLVTGTIATGMATRDTFESLLGEMLAGMRKALPVDGVILTLHGAMVAEGYPDAEAEITRRVRELVGPNTPLAITLDLHANIGQEMVDLADIVVGYDTYPHVDANERAREAVGLLARTINREISPVLARAQPPMLPVPQGMNTSKYPMAALFQHAFELEASGAALSITIAGGFPYADTPSAGFCVVVVADNDPDQATAIAAELAHMAWERRDEFLVKNVAIRDAVSEAIAHPERPVVLVDVGDNIGGGTPGDSTFLLRELLDQAAQNATIFIADHEAVLEAFSVGIGGTLDTHVGGKTDSLHGEPVPVRGTVRLLSDGRWTHDGPEMAGLPVDMGLTAVVRVDGVNLVLTSRKIAPGDLQQLKSVGIDPSQQNIIVVKAAVRWRGGYAPITRHSIDVDTPGLGSVDLTSFSFRHLRRPIYPLDPDTEWHG